MPIEVSLMVRTSVIKSASQSAVRHRLENCATHPGGVLGVALTALVAGWLASSAGLLGVVRLGGCGSGDPPLPTPRGWPLTFLWARSSRLSAIGPLCFSALNMQAPGDPPALLPLASSAASRSWPVSYIPAPGFPAGSSCL